MMDVEGQHSIKSPRNNLELDLMPGWIESDAERSDRDSIEASRAKNFVYLGNELREECQFSLLLF